jgi:hypothetical protein
MQQRARAVKYLQSFVMAPIFSSCSGSYEAPSTNKLNEAAIIIPPATAIKTETKESRR